jgi:hypothetical protein
MAGTLTPTPYQTVLDSDGVAVSGAKIYTYEAGTTTNATTYTTSALSVANANPIVADSAGRYVAYLAAGQNLRFIIKTSADVTIDDQDNIQAVPGASVNLDIEGTVGEAVTAGQVVYLSSAAESSPLTAGLWYLTDSDAAPTSTTAQTIGVAVSAIAINTSGTIRLAGLVTTAGSVVVGTTYYVAATPGAITSSAPALSRQVGVAMTTSSLVLAATTAVVAGLPNPIAQDLLFTDNTYDIGKSGATRPRDLFASRNAVIGGTLGVTGAATLTSTLAVNSTAADAIDVAGGITAGTGNVALVGTDGKLSGPLSSTIIDDLSGANLTTMNASNISSGTLANARLPSNVDLGGTLDVTGATTLDSTLDVAGAVTFNDAGGDVDLRCESSGNANMLFVDGGNNAVGIGINDPDCPLRIGFNDSRLLTLDGVGRNSGDILMSFRAGNSASTSAGTQYGAYACAITTNTDGAESASFTWDVKSAGSTTERMVLDHSGNLTADGTKSFRIDHPLMPDTHKLVFYATEGPRADCLFRGSVDLVAGSATVDIDAVSLQTDGTFDALTRDPQIWVQNTTGWDAVRGTLSGNTLTIACQDETSTDTVHWLIVADRYDTHMQTNMTTDPTTGRPLVEYEKPDPEPEP